MNVRAISRLVTSVVFVSSRVSSVESGGRNGAERGVAAMGMGHGIGAEAAVVRPRAGVVPEGQRRVAVAGVVADER